MVNSIPDLLRVAANEDAGRVALTVEGMGQLAVGDWDARSDQVAAVLRTLGVDTGSRVGLAFRAAEWIDYSVAFFGVLKAGGAVVPIPEVGSVRERERILAATRPFAVLCGEPWADLPCRAMVLADLECDGRVGSPEPVQLAPEDLAGILFTSGTSGTPKGVAFTHGNVTFAFGAGANLSRGTAGAVPQIESKAYVHAAPLWTNTGLSLLLEPLRLAPISNLGEPSRRARLHVVAQPKFHPARFCELVSHYRAGAIFLVPTMAVSLLQSGALSVADVKSVNVIAFSSAPMPPPVLRKIQDAFPSATLINRYSSTEAWPAGTFMPYDPANPRAVGRLGLGATEISTRSSDGAEVQRGSQGRVWLRLPGAPLRRYYGDDEMSRMTFVDGWVGMGDVGTLDERGYLVIDDRIDDLIVSGGHNVSSLEIEAALHEHDAVAAAAVVGIPHPSLGSQVAAAIVRARPVKVTELRRFAAERLAAYKLPTKVAFFRALPLTPAGKIDKVGVREALQVRGARTGTDKRQLTPTDRLVLEIASTALGVQGIQLHNNYFDIGGDSIGALLLTERLEDRLGIELDVSSIFESRTFRDIAAAVERRMNTRRAAGQTEMPPLT